MRHPIRLAERKTKKRPRSHAAGLVGKYLAGSRSWRNEGRNRVRRRTLLNPDVETFDLAVGPAIPSRVRLLGSDAVSARHGDVFKSDAYVRFAPHDARVTPTRSGASGFPTLAEVS